ncbi:restriction endonuclease [Kitasatospora indigofera]|uniref:restriction endonuclease n=1 Tax=Kitasatospora indigofera TaxID=67307 RepID=UPI003629F3B2
MPRNYSDLSPHDFEVLVRDLLQAELGVRMETFPPGRDGGVDIRLHHDGKETIIVQCKHSPGRRFPQIKGQLTKEAGKIRGNFNARYILATSALLTRANKAEIVKIFSGTQLSQEDVIGMDDLDNLLARHPEVEKANFKLWITSSAILEHLINSGLHGRSASFVDRIINHRKIYVHNEAFAAAQTILERNHVCVISGEPGIGKTTLAETLLVQLLSDGWEINVASADISDVERAWNPGKRQVFLYDDFLGQNSLVESLNKNEDSRLAHVIERVRGDRTKRLIMTTREYILRQASQVYEPLQRVPTLTTGKIILNLAHYTRQQKAQILYNHLHFAGLPSKALESLMKDKAYKGIIDHANFNPRIIELVTSNFENSGTSARNFASYFIGALNDPRDLWERIFEGQLSTTERNLLLVLASMGKQVEGGDLLHALTAYEACAHGSHRTDQHQLTRALKKLQGTFIAIASNLKLGKTKGSGIPGSPLTMVRFSNPSFVDYITGYLASNPADLTQIIQGCTFFEQAETIFQWIRSDRWLKGFTDPSFTESTPPRIHPWQRSPRLDSDQVDLLIHSMKRLVSASSCHWNDPHSGNRVTRKPIPIQSRHLEILKLDSPGGRSRIEEDFILAICSALEGYVTAAPWSLDQLLAVQLLEHLARYEFIESAAIQIRDTLAENLLTNATDPLEYQEIASLLDNPCLEKSSTSEDIEFRLRQEFTEFAPRWDRDESGRVNDESECEEAKLKLLDAIEKLGFAGAIETPFLDDRLQLLRDEIEASSNSDDEDSRNSEEWRGSIIARNISTSAPRPLAPADPIDDLFDSLTDR